MNDAPPPSKRQRIDPNAMDDDDILPPKGQSVLGKRKRNQKNDYYYQNKNGVQAVEKGAPADHPRNSNQFMNPNDQKDAYDNQQMNLLNNPPQPKVVDFQKGHMLDIQITDDHQETQWTTGTICRVSNDKVLIHVPRFKAMWINKQSKEIAPLGTYTDGLN